MGSQPAKTFTRKELFEWVWKEPATRIAEQCQIPYSDFKKVCDSMAIPLPGSGYWSKLRAGKAVPEAILPANYSGQQTVTIEPRTPKKKIALVSNLPEEAVSDFKRMPKVPARLTHPEPLIAAAKEKLERDKYLHNGLAGTGAGNIRISVSPKNISRALHFMDTLIKALKARGHSLQVENNTTYALIEEEKIEIYLWEKTNRNIIKEGNWDRTIYTPSGILSLKAGSRSWDSKEWKDGRLLLEDRLADIISYLEQKAHDEKEWRIKSEIAAAERREKERMARELEILQENELAKFKGLMQEAQRWRQVKMLREYIVDRKKISLATNDLSAEHLNWLEWAGKKADWYDPQINLPDALMDNVDKETLTLKKRSTYYNW